MTEGFNRYATKNPIKIGPTKMLRNMPVINIRIKNVIKKVAVLLSFMVCPAILFHPFELLFSDSDENNDIKFIFDDRVYGTPKTTKQSNLPTAFAPNIHIGHEISLFPSLEFNRWTVSQHNFNNIEPAEQISSMNLPGIGAGLFLRYTYQLPISQYVGIYVGTTTGVIGSTKTYSNFKWGYGIFFPSIMGGFTISPISALRLNFGLEYNGIWYPQMTVYTNRYQRQQTKHPLAAMLSAWDFYFENDYFFSDKLALLLTGGVRLISNACSLPVVCAGNTNYLYTLSINNFAYYGEMGVVFGVN